MGTSLGRQIGISPERQLGTSPGWSNKLFKRRSGNAGVGRPWDQHFATGIVCVYQVVNKSVS